MFFGVVTGFGSFDNHVCVFFIRLVKSFYETNTLKSNLVVTQQK